MSALWATRISTISAAAIGTGAACTSPNPLDSICQVRVRDGTARVSARALPRSRSDSPRSFAPAAWGAAFMRVMAWVSSIRSWITTTGSAPPSYSSDSTVSPSPIRPAITASNRS